METTAQQLLCPPVVAQTRPMEGCNPALPRRLRRGRDVMTEDGAVAVDTRQLSAASDTVVSRKIHRKSECVPTVVPKLAAAPHAVSEFVQPRPRDYGCGCRFCETFWTMMFQWLIQLLCRPVIINGLDRTMRMNTEYEHERIMTTNTDSPRLAVTPGE